MSSNPVHGEVYSIQHYVIKSVGDWNIVESSVKHHRHNLSLFPKSEASMILFILFVKWYINYYKEKKELLTSHHLPILDDIKHKWLWLLHWCDILKMWSFLKANIKVE